MTITIPETARPASPLAPDQVKGKGIKDNGVNIGYELSVSTAEADKTRALNKLLDGTGAMRVKQEGKPDGWQLMFCGEPVGPLTTVAGCKELLCQIINTGEIKEEGEIEMGETVAVDAVDSTDAYKGKHEADKPHEFIADERQPDKCRTCWNLPDHPIHQNKPQRADYLLINRKLHDDPQADLRIAAACLPEINGSIWLQVSEDIPGVGLFPVDSTRHAAAVRNLALLINCVSADPLPCDGVADDFAFIEELIGTYLEEYKPTEQVTIKEVLAKIKRKMGL